MKFQRNMKMNFSLCTHIGSFYENAIDKSFWSSKVKLRLIYGFLILFTQCTINKAIVKVAVVSNKKSSLSKNLRNYMMWWPIV